MASLVMASHANLGIPTDHGGRGRKERTVKNILCVGLDAALDTAYARLLTASGYRAITASVDQITSAPMPYALSVDAVIVECRESSMDKLDRLWNLRKTVPRVPILMIADCMSVEFYIRACTLGIHDYLCRPVSDRDVMKSIQAILHGDDTGGCRWLGRGSFR